ncbi:hypothetical protein [Deinococcus sp.]|uniref:hypothetical protein n=1 Tax=Deinococcus sp. TaxID=47478 RepID=UPI002869E6E7|nr:hypothetical protein [Deinococcus sp.]
MEALLAGRMGLAALPGRAVFVPLLASFTARRLNALLGLIGGSALLPTRPQTVAMAALWVVLFGMTNGALTLARAELPAGAYLQTYGTANGRLALPVNLTQAITPLSVGALYTLSTGYGPSLGLAAALLSAGSRLALRGLPARSAS